MVEIVPIGPEHVESFRRTLDAVARERRYLAMLEAPPIALYEEMGFAAEGVQRNAFKVDGRYHNLIFMAVLFEG
jgi:hypothetical protein